MSTNIFTISNWASSTDYLKHDIVLKDSRYYYAIIDHTSDSLFTSDFNGGKWGGIEIDLNGTYKPSFIWQPSFGSSVLVTPRVNQIKFGDGYEQRIQDGINNILLELDLTFEKLDLAEFTAICHFLTERKGKESFFFTPPQPFNSRKRFISRSFESSWTNINNNVIKTKFEEMPI